MPRPTLTIKQEKFCLAYIETGSSTEAYRRSYNIGSMKPITINRKATEVLQNAKVQERVKELKGDLVKRYEVTVDSLVGELEEARTLAIRIEAPAPAVSATMGKGKLLGLVVEKNEHAGKDGKPIEIADMTDTESARRVAYMLGQAMARKKNAPVSAS
jgi:hypothetical protein